MVTYYRDADSDGHGNPAMPVMACAPPAGTVTTNDDCDDTTAQRHPGLAEICDLLDNDCNAATADNATCPVGCAVSRRPAPNDARAYLACSAVTSWISARTTCANAMYKLVQIEDLAENQYVRSFANGVFGIVGFHIGGTDATTEGAWVWEGTTDQFWQGTANGMPIGGRYTNWDGGEPNDSSAAEDCTEMKADGLWNDISCVGTALRFVCRR
jgi:hypothetical protein